MTESIFNMQFMLMAAMVLVALGGANAVFWSTVGALRYLAEKRDATLPRGDVIDISEVAVIIAAHNEEATISACLKALEASISLKQVFVANDGSTDGTAKVVRAHGCNVVEIQPNRGKAGAIAHAIQKMKLCKRFKAILILDADSELDANYFKNALPILSKDGVAVVAGYVKSRWPSTSGSLTVRLIASYRTRLYSVVQAVFQYGQSWKCVNVSYIAPGVASLYRAEVVSRIDICAPNLVIEDFNMTFEVHRKKLGRIAHSPNAICCSEDPLTLRDYRRQVQRWYLGFWQTVHRNGMWSSWFWVALALLLAEVFAFSAVLVALPGMVLASLVFELGGQVGLPIPQIIGRLPVLEALLAFLIADYMLTVMVGILQRRHALFVFGLLFPLLRVLDAALFLMAFLRSFWVKSDGRWRSPARSRPVVVGEASK